MDLETIGALERSLRKVAYALRADETDASAACSASTAYKDVEEQRAELLDALQLLVSLTELLKARQSRGRIRLEPRDAKDQTQ